LIIAALGLAAPFLLNAISYLGVITALIWWRESGRGGGHLPAEVFTSAIRVGLRHARFNPHLRSTLIRAFGFFPFASAYWALLPLVARNQVAGGPELYGFLLGAISVGAILGALALPHIKSAMGPDRLVAAGTIGTAIALTLFGLARHQLMALLASVIAGVSWIAVLATINVSAQVALPGWVRGRGLSLLAATMFGGLTIGSLIWGQVAAVIGLPGAHFVAASLAVAALPFLRQKLETGGEVDLVPSMHWPSPPFILPMPRSIHGPVLVTIEYRIDIKNRNLFLTALTEFSHERSRDGAYAWRVFEDTSKPGRFLEAFMVESWEEHLRQHERVTNADRISQNEIRKYTIGGDPVVTHFIAATPE
jgi:hypothetical protein